MGEDLCVVFRAEQKERALPCVTLDKGLTKVVGASPPIQAKVTEPLKLPPVEVVVDVEFPKGPEPEAFVGHFCLCIDLSGSMNGQPIWDVKAVLKQFLTKCLQYLTATPASKIFVSLMGFDDKVIYFEYQGKALPSKLNLRDSFCIVNTVVDSVNNSRLKTKVLWSALKGCHLTCGLRRTLLRR